MNFFNKLQESRGELLRLNASLFWYSKGDWDYVYDRICLIVDVIEGIDEAGRWIDPPDGVIVQAYTGRPEGRNALFEVGVLLMIDGVNKWVWVDKRHVELITSEPA
jgi:hypothetical protein